MEFVKESPKVMGELSAAFAAVLTDARCALRASDLVDKLKLDKTLAWHVAEIAAAQVPLLVAEHVPGEEGMRIVLKAAAAQGARTTHLNRLRESVAKFRELLDQHAGDRTTLESMLADLAQRRFNSRSYETARKDAYRANVSIFGFSALTQCQVDFLAPGESKNTLDFACLRAFTGLTRYHTDAAWHFGRTREHRGGKRVENAWPKPLDPAARKKFNAPLIPQFCSDSIPLAFETPDVEGMINQYITDGPIGLRGSFDLAFGEFAKSVGHVYATKADDEGECFVALYTPCKMLVHDLLIHRKLGENAWRGISPECLLLGELHAGQFHPRGDRHKPRLPLEPRPSFVGPADALPTVPDLPRRSEMVDYACKKMGWRSEDFQAYRLRLAFPSIPSTAVQRIRLPAE